VNGRETAPNARDRPTRPAIASYAVISLHEEEFFG